MNYLILDDCKDAVLSDRVWRDSIDYGLFHFTPDRKILDKANFANFAFFDLFINHKVAWGAPVPTTFQAFFPDLMKIMVPEEETLFFNVVDQYESYFEESKFIDEFLKPNDYLYFFLDKEYNGRSFPTLFFECPVNQVPILNEVGFGVMGIDIEGFILKRSKANLFKKFSGQGNTDDMFRDLITAVYMAFGIWGDHNGLFGVTNKFDIPTLEKKLLATPLEKEIEKYVENYDNAAP